MFDDYRDLRDSLDRQLLEREDPPAHADARRRLEAAQLKVDRIINVYPDSILYVDRDGRAMTAWARKMPAPSTGITYLAEPGFSAFPSPYLEDAPA